MAPRKQVDGEKLTSIIKNLMYIVVLVGGIFAGFNLKINKYSSLKSTLQHQIKANSAAIERQSKIEVAWRNDLYARVKSNGTELGKINITLATMNVHISNLTHNRLK